MKGDGREEREDEGVKEGRESGARRVTGGGKERKWERKTGGKSAKGGRKGEKAERRKRKVIENSERRERNGRK